MPATNASSTMRSMCAVAVCSTWSCTALNASNADISLDLRCNRRATDDSRYSSRSSNILTWVPRLNRLPSSSLSWRVSRMVCMIVSAAVRFSTRSPAKLAANRTHSTGLMPLMSSA